MDQEVKNGSLGKKLIVPVVAVALFAVLVFGATYAYFSASTTTTNVANLTTQLENSSTVFLTNANTCSMLIPASDMVKANVSETAKNSTTCFLDVTLNGTKNVSCTYDLTLAETGTHYEATDASMKEFTVEISNVTASDNETLTTVAEAAGTNVDTYMGGTSKTVKGTQKITVQSTGAMDTHHYEVTMRWYNINKEQDAHAGKTYTYELKATNVVC